VAQQGKTDLTMVLFTFTIKMTRARQARFKAVAMRKHRMQNVLSVTFPPTFVVRRLAAVGSERFWGVDSSSFLVGFSTLGNSLVFWFRWRHRLAAVGQRTESCFVLVLRRS